MLWSHIACNALKVHQPTGFSCEYYIPEKHRQLQALSNCHYLLRMRRSFLGVVVPKEHARVFKLGDVH